MLAALTVLPALLAVLGPRVNALRIRRCAVRRAAGPAGGREAQRRLVPAARAASCAGPVLYAVSIVVVLLALGAPFLRITWGGTDATALPAAAVPRRGHRGAEPRLPRQLTAPIEAVVRFTGPVAGSPAGRPRSPPT